MRENEVRGKKRRQGELKGDGDVEKRGKNVGIGALPE